MTVTPVVVVSQTSSSWLWVVIILIIIILVVAIVILGVFFRQPVAPIAPTNFTGQTTSPTSVRLTWSHPVNFNPTGYVVYVDSTPTLNSAMISWVPGTATSLNLTLTGNTCWYFAIASQSTLNGQTITGPYRLPLLTICLSS